MSHPRLIFVQIIHRVAARLFVSPPDLTEALDHHPAETLIMLASYLQELGSLNSLAEQDLSTARQSLLTAAIAYVTSGGRPQFNLVAPESDIADDTTSPLRQASEYYFSGDVQLAPILQLDALATLHLLSTDPSVFGEISEPGGHAELMAEAKLYVRLRGRR